MVAAVAATGLLTGPMPVGFVAAAVVVVVQTTTTWRTLMTMRMNWWAAASRVSLV